MKYIWEQGKMQTKFINFFAKLDKILSKHIIISFKVFYFHNRNSFLTPKLYFLIIRADVWSLLCFCSIHESSTISRKRLLPRWQCFSRMIEFCTKKKMAFAVFLMIRLFKQIYISWHVNTKVSPAYNLHLRVHPCLP